MASWWWQQNVTDKVGHFAAAARQEAAHRVGLGGIRSADDLASELEKQASKIHGPQGMTDLVSQWVDWSDQGYGSYEVPPDTDEVAGGERLTFQQALLRSHAFEGALDSCSKMSTLRVALQAGKQDGEIAALLNILRIAADRLLLPGCSVLWAGLLDVLFKSTGAGDRRTDQPSTTIEMRCDHWARRALAVVKRRWRTELLPEALKRLDQEVTKLAAQASTEDAKADAGSDFIRPAGGQQMSKQAIRQALARDRLLQLSATAKRLKERTQVLCTICSRLEKTEDETVVAVQEAERLLEDASAMLTSLDTRVKDCIVEQEQLEAALNEVSGGLQKQITQVHETLGSVAERRTQLHEEKAQLLRRLEEVSMHLDQLSETEKHCEREEGKLKVQLKETTNSYEERIAESFCRQRLLADEKLRAVVCKECAHSILDVTKGFHKQQLAEWEMQLSKRRSELRHCCALYLQQERFRVEAAAECFTSRTPKPTQAKSVQGSDDLSDTATQALTSAQESWQRAQATLRSVEPLLRVANDAGEQGSSSPSPPSSPLMVVPGEEGTSVLDEQEDAASFFTRVVAAPGHKCVDCGLPGEADWASVSHGTYLCMDCAGKHRGLGVHLSFVRSTTMDVWSDQQLQRMRLGGNEAFLKFLGIYPELREQARTPAALSTKYNSRAAAHYRSWLDARCEAQTQDDSKAQGTKPPSYGAPKPSEGHLPAEASAKEASAASYTEVKKGGASGGLTLVGSGSSADGSGVGTMEEEKAALEKAYLKHQLQLQMSLAPVDAAPAAAAPAVAPKSKPVVAAAAPPPEPSEGRGGSKSSSSDRLAPGSKSEVSDVHRHTRRSSDPAQAASSGSGTETAPSTTDQSMAASEASRREVQATNPSDIGEETGLHATKTEIREEEDKAKEEEEIVKEKEEDKEEKEKGKEKAKVKGNEEAEGEKKEEKNEEKRDELLEKKEEDEKKEVKIDKNEEETNKKEMKSEDAGKEEDMLDRSKQEEGTVKIVKQLNEDEKEEDEDEYETEDADDLDLDGPLPPRSESAAALDESIWNPDGL